MIDPGEEIPAGWKRGVAQKNLKKRKIDGIFNIYT